ncbi:hypothetical protein T492DRAFT_1114764 [Pavlovales sp. CCMP2436]|nr:hypothetical protein T492DRAFT_1114764 [Pavlovales sp. CCMP2436]
MSAPEHVLDYRTSTCFPLHPARHGQEEPQGQKASVRNNPCFTSPVFFSVGLILLALLIFLEVTVASRALGPLEIAELVLIPVLLWFPALALLALTSPCVRFRIRTSRWGVRPTNKAAIVLAFTGPSPLGVAGDGLADHCSSARRHKHSRPTRIVDEQSGGKYVLYDRGQFDQLSVGACVHTAAHGWAKEAWFIESVMAIEVVERGSGKVMEVRKDDADFLRCCFDERYVILDIEIALMTNQKLRVQQKTFKPPSGDKAADIRSGPDIAEWEQADFKLMFIYPTQIISKTAVKVLTDVRARAVRSGMWLLHPAASLFVPAPLIANCKFYALQLGCGQRTDFIDSVADAHTIVKTIWGLEALVVNLTRYVNLEIFTVDPFDMRSAMLTANRLHVKIGGRTEFCKRTVTGGTMIWAFDFAAPVGKVGTDGVGENLCEWIEEIHQHGYRRAALHPGKL